ncbi:MAG: nucleotidyltransferase domain-containing protein, partial [archaeon]|nr:nucleotidyltransferase domain-containing protein [archaeon]
VLKEVIKKITPSNNELKDIKKILDEFLVEFKKNSKKLKIDAEVFVGGSFAKGTVIKKDHYDLDIFIRFNKKYKDSELSDLTEKILKKFTENFLFSVSQTSKKQEVRDIKNFHRIHGSRDYFNIQARNDLYLEIIPVINVNKPKESNNITDLSYSHVKYVRKKLKKNMLDDVRLTKAFCYANNCYGAESYIRGLSGYVIELLICYYKSFPRFLAEITKENKKQIKEHKNLWSKEYENHWKDIKNKIVIDIEKQYKNRELVLMDLNSSKLESPIIVIDPTFKERNAAAALSYETFEKFKKACREFMKNPSEKFFEAKKIDFEKARIEAGKKKQEFIILEIETDRQEGDIAGSKLLKFFNHLKKETGKSFEIKNSGFEYNNEKKAKCFISAARKKEIIFNGPYLKQKENVIKFKKEHKTTFVKKDRIFAREKIIYSIKGFILQWKNKNSVRINEMSVINLRIL